MEKDGLAIMPPLDKVDGVVGEEQSCAAWHGWLLGWKEAKL
jgi:hypothetical protein